MDEHRDVVAAQSRRVRDILATGKCVGSPAAFDAAIDERRTPRTLGARREATAYAARLCAGCPVQGVCLAAAVLSGERNGVRGGRPSWRLRQLAASVRKGTLAPLHAELGAQAVSQPQQVAA